MTTDDHQEQLLRSTLQLAVPLEIEKLRGTDPRVLLEHARAQDLTTADAMMFGGEGCGPALAAHVRVLAALALTAWGGVTLAGMHWCADTRCTGRDAHHDSPTWPDEAHLHPPATRPVTTVLLPESEAA